MIRGPRPSSTPAFLKLWAGQTASQLGILGALQTIAFLLIGLPAGAWVDRWRKGRR